MSKSLDAFFVKAKDPSIDLVSVDIFDTLLYRNTIPEDMRFYEISKVFSQLLSTKYNINISTEDLFIQRLLSAKYAYRLTSKIKSVREANHRTIVYSILNAFELDESYYNDYQNTEIQYEIESLQLNRKIVDYLHELKHAMNKKVIAISDMYLTSGQISQLVKAKLKEFTLDEIYSSADFGINKATGHLYPKVAELEGIDYENWIHCGDNYGSDYLSPAKLGITSVFTPRDFAWRVRAKLHREFFKFNNKLSYL